MKSINRRSMVGLLAAAPLVGGLLPKSLLASAREDGAPPKKWRVVSSRERTRELHFPDVVLTTHEGKKVRFYEDLIKDKLVVINFMYAKCEGVCPGITTNLRRVQKLLGDRVGRDIFFYSFTLKPQIDTPEKMAEYARMHKAGPGWLFLTGAPADMEDLRVKLGFTNPDPVADADVTQHIGNIRYGNEALEWWAACPGMSKPDAIVQSILWLDWPKDSKATGKGEGK
jgi:protein SCO1/2